MRLAEALRLRSDHKSHLSKLYTRTRENVLVQEGDEPVEDPTKLFEEYLKVAENLKILVVNINITNSTKKVSYKKESITLTQALAIREDLEFRGRKLRKMAKEGIPPTSYSRSEIRIVPTISVRDYQKQADQMSKELREIDTIIQEHNWSTNMTEFVKSP